MKRITLITALTTAIALFSFATTINAQYRATGPDGITASPKVRQNLSELPRNSTTSQVKGMSCASCKDEFATRVDWTAKGANKPTVLVPQHLCPGCSTSIVVTGIGKAKQSVAKHECTMSESKDLACCNKVR